MLSASDMSGLKAVLFDLGNTLVHLVREPSDEIFEMFTSRLDDNHPKPSFDDFKSMIHRYWREMQDEYYSEETDEPIAAYNSRFMQEWGYSKETGDRLGAFFSDLIFKYELHSTGLMPGALELLDWLKASRFLIGLITNASHSEERIHKLIRTVGIEDYFNVVLVSSAVGIRKPHPEIFLKALSLLHVLPIESLYIGDRQDYDAHGAENAGMRWVLLDNETTLFSTLNALKLKY